MIWESHFGTEESKVYGEALDALNSSGIRYLLGGALALNAHTSIWRDTKDLDLFVPKQMCRGFSKRRRLRRMRRSETTFV